MLATTIKAYLYEEYADDDALQAFFNAYNDATQTYVDWFNTVSLPFYCGLSGPLLDWVGEGIYGLPRSAVRVSSNIALGPLNTELLNTATLNSFIAPSATYYTLTDDIYKRVLTWDFFKGDGKHFSMRWLKRRVMRFLLGVNGINPQAGTPGFTIGTENTSPVSVVVAGNLLTVTINQTQLSTLASVTPNIVNTFSLAFLGGILDLPAQYAYAVHITG